MVKNLSSLFSNKKRTTPELKLQMEEQQVLSNDFNLFYKPEEEPLPSGLVTFAKSLDSWVHGAGTDLALAGEHKQKKSESAKALKDYNNLKLKFRDAVKKGDIKKEANPYYLQEYKRLSLNSYASQFSDHVLKRYNDLDIGNNITEGAFESFYKDELKLFIKKHNLGQFEAVELEDGFFQETSEYRNQLEATHKSNLMTNFNKNFDDKVVARVVGVITKYKNLKNNPLHDYEGEVNIYQRIADDLQKEIGLILDVTGSGTASIDAVFKGLQLYVSQTDDYEFAKKVIRNVPKLLVGGTGKVSEIGRIKVETNKLKRLLFDKANEALNNKNNFEKNLRIDQQLKTFSYLENEVKNNPDFNVTEWKNDENRTQGEIQGAEAYIAAQSFDGGNSDNKLAVQDIELLILDGKYGDAHQLAIQFFKSGDIKKSTYENYIRVRIPDAKDYGENPFFDIQTVSATLKVLQKIMESGRGGDALDAVAGNAYLKDQMNKWLKKHKDDDKYKGNLELMEEDFEKYFLQKLILLKKHGDLNLWGKGQIALEGEGTLAQNIEKKIKSGIKINKKAQTEVEQKIRDDLKILDNIKFERKYKITKEEMKKIKGWN